MLLFDWYVGEACKIGLIEIWLFSESVGRKKRTVNLHCINNENKEIRMNPEQDDSNITQYK